MTMARFLFKYEVYIIDYLPLPDNAVIFDIGCSYGEYTSEVIRKMGKRPFSVHCFDPVKDFCNKQCDLFGHIPGIRINNFGLYNEKKESIFYRINAPGNEASEGCSSLCLRPDFITQHWPYVPITVKLDTLDNYIKERAIKHIDLMKIDVEGAELGVFQGGREMFANETVDFIQFEYNSCLKDMGVLMADIIKFIEPFNYSLCDFLGDKPFNYDLDDYPDGRFVRLASFIDDYGHHNYFLINDTYLDNL